MADEGAATADGHVRETKPAVTTDESSLLQGLSKPTKNLKYRLFDTHGWLVECSTLLLSATALAVAIVLLVVYHNSISPNWPLGITLNTVIAILSNVFRSSLMLCVASAISQSGWIWYARGTRPLKDVCLFDSASRGPLGSLELLWRVKFLRSAGLGAFITIIALAVEPCFQLTVKYEIHSTIDHTTDAQAVTAYSYNGQSGAFDTYSDADVMLPYNMQTAMYSGLLSSNALTIPGPPFNCPSGNCTWDPFGTLAVHVACTDVSSLVHLNCSDWIYPWDNKNLTVNTCNFASNQDSLLRSMLNDTDAHDFYVGEAYQPMTSLQALTSYSRITGALATVQWVRVKNVLASAVAFNDRYSIPTAMIMSDTPYEAGRCFFFLAVDHMKVKVLNGLYIEEILEQYSEIPTTGRPTYTLNGHDFYFRDPYDWDSDLLFQPSFSPERNFSVTWQDFDSLSMSIQRMPFQARVETGTSEGFITTTSTSNYSDNAIPRLLLQSDNVTRAMENMAYYMTTALRSNNTQLLQTATGDPSILAPEQIVKGRNIVQAQFVKVDWIWLLLPAITLLLTLLLLGHVIGQTSHHRLGTWKSSPLTLLFQSNSTIGSGLKQRLERGDLDSAESMEDAAQKLEGIAYREKNGVFEITIK